MEIEQIHEACVPQLSSWDWCEVVDLDLKNAKKGLLMGFRTWLNSALLGSLVLTFHANAVPGLGSDRSGRLISGLSSTQPR